ncbi:MAG TPA: DUF3024 domain-containing protein [Steroidobacteraceae bacterium]|nr:DUF3024 domain-containing protein [Steroidobacteraceae bacterium]HRX90434.1 DUF3024 domain-containing protein [Steroidobacteraceae bacterium]
MNEIPQHTAHLVERLLRRYCERICPPTARHAVPLAFELQTDRVKLFELRRICGVPGAMQRLPLAELRYSAREGRWYLYQRTASCLSGAMTLAECTPRWQRYRAAGSALAGSRNLLDLLREIDADPAGIFWPRINGASLRWCSSRGRCADCAARYEAILGIENRRQAKGSPSLAADITSVE